MLPWLEIQEPHCKKAPSQPIKSLLSFSVFILHRLLSLNIFFNMTYFFQLLLMCLMFDSVDKVDSKITFSWKSQQHVKVWPFTCFEIIQ